MGRRSFSRFCAVIGLALGGLRGCTGTVPPRAIAAPDISLISVFYPVDGLVRGRGGEGTFADPAIEFVVVAARPTGTETILPIETDGSFNFAIIALSDDVLEISGTTDPGGKERGEPAYVRVPPLAPAYPHFVCCYEAGGDKGTCTTEEQMTTTNTCADMRAGAMQCDSILECRNQNHEILAIRKDMIQVTPPGADGKIQVTGKVESAGALVRMENRGQRAIGGYDPRIKLAQISDSSGIFKFKNVNARGDDELVISVLDLLGNKSPQASILVPDAPLDGFDIVGAYPYQRLDNGKVGTVAVRFHPSGIDGRGICPASTTDPVLCFTGGLTHDMVRIDSVRFDRIDSNNPPPRETPASGSLVNNRGTEGDPLTPSQMVVLVIDNHLPQMGEMVTDPGPAPRRFDAAKEFVRSLRKRDRLAVVSYGGPAGMSARIEAQLGGSENGWVTQLAAIDAIAARGGEGPADLFGGIEKAADVLDLEKQTRLNGTIVVIATSDAMGTPVEAEAAFAEALVKIQPDRETGFRGYQVYLMGVNIPQPMYDVNGELIGNIDLLQSIAGFSADGRFVNLGSIAQVGEAFGDAAGFISGSFVLLYDMFIPEQAGKSARLEISATVMIPNASGGVESRTATYEGPITIDQADN